MSKSAVSWGSAYQRVALARSMILKPDVLLLAEPTPNLDPYNFEFKNSDDFVIGGATANLGLTLTTPCTPGEYEGTWRMRDDKGYYFGTYLTVIVKVTDKCK